MAASTDRRFTKYIHLQQPHDGKFKNPNFYGKSPIEPIIRTPERLQIKKVIDKKVAQNSKCFYNLFIKIFIQSHMQKKPYHRYIHWPLAAVKPRGFLVHHEIHSDHHEKTAKPNGEFHLHEFMPPGKYYTQNTRSRSSTHPCLYSIHVALQHIIHAHI